jgi:hypothetical protein
MYHENRAQMPVLSKINIYAEQFVQYSSTNGRIVAVMFRLRNKNKRNTAWIMAYQGTAYSGWSERMGIALNGVSISSSATSQRATSSLSLKPGMNTVIVTVSSSLFKTFGPNGLGVRSVNLGFENMNLPSGVEYEDDLYQGNYDSSFISSSFERPALGEKRIPLFRWQVWDTYDNSGGWLMKNDAQFYGGVSPSVWTDGSGKASSMSQNFDVLRTFYTRTGPIVDAEANNFKGMLVTNEVSHMYSSTNGKMASALFRVRNSNKASTVWAFSYMATSYGGWGEWASVALNGENAHSAGANDGAAHSYSVNLSLRPGMNTVIVVAASGKPSAVSSNQIRTCSLAITGNTLTLPAGLAFVDDLFEGGWVSGWAIKLLVRHPIQLSLTSVLSAFLQGAGGSVTEATPRASKQIDKGPMYRWASFQTYANNLGSWFYGNGKPVARTARKRGIITALIGLTAP